MEQQNLINNQKLQAVLLSGKFSPEILSKLALSPNMHLRVVAARNHATPQAVLYMLCSDPVLWVARQAMSNPVIKNLDNLLLEILHTENINL